MDRSKLFWGVFLIFAGILIIATRFDIINYDFVNVIRLWPIFLIMFGLSLFKFPEYIRYLFTVLSAVFLTVFLYAVITLGFRVSLQNLFDFDKPSFERELNQEYIELNETATLMADDSSYQNGKLYLDFAAGSFNLYSSSAYMFKINGNSFKYNFDTLNNSKGKRIDLNISSPAGGNYKSKDADNFNLDLAIGKNLKWDLFFKFGACEADIDVTNIKFGLMEIKSGAASIDLKLGNSDVFQKVVINSGASSFNILLPSNSFCKLKSKTILSAEKFDKFVKQGEFYILNNGTDGGTEIEFEIKGAVSEFNVMLY